jgi:hypothetical protein
MVVPKGYDIILVLLAVTSFVAEAKAPAFASA